MAKKIMVVDDDPNIVTYITTILEDAGYETCSAAEGGDAAYRILEECKPDLITLDLDMPGEWGPRFYRRFSKKPEFKDIPVIVVSGLSGITHAVNTAVAVIKKPFEPEDLLEIVRKTIG